MTSWLRKLLQIAHFPLLALLILSGMASEISPQSVEWTSVVGMGFPYLMLVNILLTLFWISNKKWMAIPGILVIFWFGSTIFHFVQFNTHEKEFDVKVMSFNIRSFNKYGWKPNKNTKSDIVSFMQKEDAEIICFQEFYDLPGSEKYNTAALIRKETGCGNFFMENYYRHHKALGKRYFGLAIFSKHKILNGNVAFQLKGEKKARAIYADIVIKEDTIRVYNLHLRSIRLGKADYQFLNDVTESSNEEKLSKSRTIIQKLERAFQLRSIEADSIRKHIDNSPYPTIIMGDFNEVANTYAYTTITEGLKDGFIEKGRGLGWSYEGKGMLLSQRIDYIITSPEIDFQSFTTHSEVDLSDHKPISATLRLNL